VAANATSAARSDTLTIAGINVAVNQNANGVPAIILDAAAIDGLHVDLAWTAVNGATYTVQRSQNGAAFATITSSSGLAYTDTTVTAGAGYVYQIAAIQNTTTIGYSNVDLAVPFDYADPSLNGVFIQALHFNQLRTVLNAARAVALWPAYPFTDTLSNGVLVKRIHLVEPRMVLDGVRAAFGLPPISYIDPSITAGVTVIKASQLQQIRDGVK